MKKFSGLIVLIILTLVSSEMKLGISLSVLINRSKGHYYSLFHLTRLQQCTLAFIQPDPLQEYFDTPPHLVDSFQFNWKDSRSKQINYSSSDDPSLRGQVKKFGSNCILCLITLACVSTNNFEETVLPLFNLLHSLTLTTSPVAKINEDYFIFMSHSASLVDKTLSHKEISYKIKYKIGLVLKTNFGNGELYAEVHTLCLYCENGEMSLRNFVLSSHFGMTLEKTDLSKYLLEDHTRNLHRRLLIISSIPSSPHVHLQKVPGSTDGKDEYTPINGGGTNVQNFLRISEALNFTFKIFLSSGGGGTGLKLANGSWNGQIGDILSGSADIGILAGVTLDRYAVCDFSAFHRYAQLIFCYGPTKPIQAWLSLFWPFSINLWLGIILSTVIVIGFLNLVPWIEKRFLTTRNNYTVASVNCEKKYWNFSQTVEFVITSFLLQNYSELRSPPLKCFSFYWSFFVIVITTVYLSNMYVLYMNPPIEKSPNNLAELASDTSYHIFMTYYGGALLNIFQYSNNTVELTIFKRWKLEKPENCLRRAFQPKFCCLSFDTDFKNLQWNLQESRRKRRIIWHRVEGYGTPLGLPMIKRSILLSTISKITSSAFETGLTEWWAWETSATTGKQIYSLNSTGSDMDDDEWTELKDDGHHKRLTLRQLRGAFVSFISGIVLAVTIFLKEISPVILSSVLCLVKVKRRKVKVMQRK